MDTQEGMCRWRIAGGCDLLQRQMRDLMCDATEIERVNRAISAKALAHVVGEVIRRQIIEYSSERHEPRISAGRKREGEVAEWWPFRRESYRPGSMNVISIRQTELGGGRGSRGPALGNCTIGLTPEHEIIYMVDFGISKRYIDPHTQRHIPDSKRKRDFLGKYWFTSVNAHLCDLVVATPSRRDDLEAVALMFIHLLAPDGFLWTLMHTEWGPDSTHDRITRAKKSACPEVNLRSSFGIVCGLLKFYDCPDYDRWKYKFKALAQDSGFTDIEHFIWPPLPAPQVRPAPIRPTIGAMEMENVLDDLAMLQFNPPRPILGDQTNVPAPARTGDARNHIRQQQLRGR
ncbi:hypothetical protein DFH29DRAFT_876602 [Suillus ampliporus]|nr:hypothetical protein DFH29DRAFT_876602 [Suillus ampliporus]